VKSALARWIPYCRGLPHASGAAIARGAGARVPIQLRFARLRCDLTETIRRKILDLVGEQEKWNARTHPLINRGTRHCRMTEPRDEDGSEQLRVSGPVHSFAQIGNEDFALVHDLRKIDARRHRANRRTGGRRRQQLLDFVQDRIDRGGVIVVVSRRIFVSEESAEGRVVHVVQDPLAIRGVFQQQWQTWCSAPRSAPRWAKYRMRSMRHLQLSYERPA
jgi:hypothetical protein